MDLPPSGWYPDPYGAPDLLRWWDGSTWTHHTHAGVGAADAGGGGSMGGAHRAAAVQQTTIQPTTVQSATIQSATIQSAGGQSAGAGWATRDRVIGDWAGTDWPTGDQLANTMPPKGPRTEPQPALPTTSILAGGAAVGGPNGADGSGTQVLFLGDDAWQVPGGPAGPGGPGGPVTPNRYGYQQAQRRRRMWLIGGLIAGTAVAIAIIVVVATSLGSSSTPTTADQAASTPSAAASLTPTAAATPTPTASASASATPPASVLSDGQSGLSYAQLATPWQTDWPNYLDSAVGWTAGESAVAGQVNGGQTTWYGEAVSGPLPAQYNYTTVADLNNTATNLAQTMENAYYNSLSHTIQPELSQPITISGHPGWEIEYQVDYTNATAQGASWSTEEGAVVVVDTGTGNTPVVFFTSIPDNLGETNVALLISSLQLTVVPGASTVSPTPGAPTAAPGGSPTAANP